MRHLAPRLAQAPALHHQHRTYVILTASELVRQIDAPHYTVVDTYGAGASVYARPRYSLVAELTPLQAAIIDAIRRLRRWRYYSDLTD
jgi:hypothetical protein